MDVLRDVKDIMKRNGYIGFVAECRLQTGLGDYEARKSLAKGKIFFIMHRGQSYGSASGVEGTGSNMTSTRSMPLPLTLEQR